MVFPQENSADDKYIIKHIVSHLFYEMIQIRPDRKFNKATTTS